MRQETLLQRALHAYDNLQCFTLKEFESDFNKGVRVKTLLDRYDTKPATALILNHIVIIFNVFDSVALPILLTSVGEEHYSRLFTFLKFLDRLPDKIPEFGIDTASVKIDEELLKELESL